MYNETLDHLKLQMTIMHVMYPYYQLSIGYAEQGGKQHDRIKLTDLVLGPHKMVDNMAAGSVAAAVTEPPEFKNFKMPSPQYKKA